MQFKITLFQIEGSSEMAFENEVEAEEYWKSVRSRPGLLMRVLQMYENQQWSLLQWSAEVPLPCLNIAS